MGLLIKKGVRKALEGKSVAGSYAVIVICVLLVALNIMGFIFFPKLLSPIAIILSNVITMLVTALAFRPVNNLIQNALISKQAELAESIEKEKQMKEKMDALQTRNIELESKLDIRDQTGTAPADVNFTFKLEQMEYAKKGYVVREDQLDHLLSSAELADKIPDKGLIDKLFEGLRLKEQGVRKILYIKKFYYKASIGIDFTRIKFAMADGTLLFSGVKFAKLHDITSELEHDSTDIDHIWILNSVEGKSTILQGPEYDRFKESYSAIRAAETQEALEAEVDRLCGKYTEAFRSSIRERYTGVDFVDAMDDANTWYALQEARRDPRVMAVASNMLMLTDVINRTAALDQAEDE